MIQNGRFMDTVPPFQEPPNDESQYIFDAFSEVQATTAPAHPMSWIVLLHWSWRYTPGLALNNLIPLSFKSWYGYGSKMVNIYHTSLYHNMSRNDLKSSTCSTPQTDQMDSDENNLHWVAGDDIRCQLVPEWIEMGCNWRCFFTGSSRLSEIITLRCVWKVSPVSMSMLYSIWFLLIHVNSSSGML